MKKPPRIVVFIDWFIPAYKAGGPISSIANIVKELYSKADFYIITSAYDLGESDILKGIIIGKWNTVAIEKITINVRYLSNEEINRKTLLKLVNEINPSVIHLNSLFSRKFTLLPLRLFKAGSARIVVSPRGMLGPASVKIKPLKKKIFFAYARWMGLYKGILWHATSNIEKKEIHSMIDLKAKVHIAQNFASLPSNTNEVDSIRKEKGSIRLISVGRISPIKNIDFVLRLLPKIKTPINYTIIGPIEDDLYYNQCKQLADQLPPNCKVEFIGGVVPSQLATFYAKNHVFISPTLNENFGHSIIEALGYGCPIIISQNTPWKNLTDTNEVGYDLPLKESDFIQVINEFIGLGEPEFSVLRNNAQHFASVIVNDTELVNRYAAIYDF